MNGGAPGGVRTHTGTLLRGLPLPVGLRGRGRECRRAPWPPTAPGGDHRFGASIVGSNNHDPRPHRRSTAADARERRSTRRRVARGTAPAIASALDLAAAAAPAAHAPAVAGVAAVGDPRSDRAGAAAAEAAAVTVACRTGLHVARPPSGRVRGAVTGHTQCDRRYNAPHPGVDVAWSEAFVGVARAAGRTRQTPLSLHGWQRW